MPAYEYRVTSAPRQGARVKGVRAPEARFAFALEAEMNRMALDGWEYVRSDTLPHEERQGWFRAKAVVSRTVLVFRRPIPDEAEVPHRPPAYVAPLRAAPARVAPVRPASIGVAPSRPAAQPETWDPATEEPPLAAPTPPDPPMPPAAVPLPVPPMATSADPVLPPVLSPPPLAPAQAPGLAAGATTVLAASRRVQVPPPPRPRDGTDHGPGPSGTALG